MRKRTVDQDVEGMLGLIGAMRRSDGAEATAKRKRRKREPSMLFTVRFYTGNAAFDPDAGPEVARILHKLADDCREDLTCPRAFALRDVNGNTVGHAEWRDENAPAGE